ncbi:hypothetical protein D7V86_08830 [bacterium D16-51]|nr:hypothetical protein D7V96_08845 [bacterium D16-59]RKI60470.1 hypothetical protein D7V86_08830 [bacterium D16-51]
MRKKLLVLGLAAIVGAASVPAGYMLSKAPIVASAEENDDTDAWDDDDAEEADSIELTKGYVVVNPAKKTIKVGKSFTVNLYQSSACEKEYGEIPDEEWDELVDECIDDITFRSTKSSVASVNSNGKVKGKKKGSAIIKTTVTFRDGSEGIYKTKVYVTK